MPFIKAAPPKKTAADHVADAKAAAKPVMLDLRGNADRDTIMKGLLDASAAENVSPPTPGPAAPQGADSWSDGDFIHYRGPGWEVQVKA